MTPHLLRDLPRLLQQVHEAPRALAIRLEPELKGTFVVPRRIRQLQAAVEQPQGSFRGP